MESALASGLQGLFLGVVNLSIYQVIMLVIACVLLYLGIEKGYEPLLLVPIGFGAIMVNIPLADMMGKEGFLRFFYDAGVLTEVFPLLIFIGIGAMTDFQPLLQNPKIILLGAAGQFGIFLTLLLALALGFDKLDAVAVAIIGACDGPTAIYVSSKFAPHMLGAVSVAAYSYMSLVPLIQPPIMRALTSEKERQIIMGAAKREPISKTTKIVFPIVVTIFASILAPKGAPLIGTVLLGLCIGATMEANNFLRGETLLILCLGFIAISLDTAVGVLFGKLMCALTGGKINPLIGAAGISAFPMSARVVKVEDQKYNKKDYLLMHAMSATAGGQIGSVIAAAVMLSVLQGMGIVGG